MMFPGEGGPPVRMGPRGAGPAASAPARRSFLSSLYYDDFRWAVVKSAGFFLVGIYLGKEFKGVDLMAPPAQP